MSYWFEDHNELLVFARVLHACDAFSSIEDAFYFFEKPWKWDEEYVRWVRLGRPAGLTDLAALQAAS